jgi:hypothetical protein
MNIFQSLWNWLTSLFNNLTVSRSSPRGDTVTTFVVSSTRPVVTPLDLDDIRRNRVITSPPPIPPRRHKKHVVFNIPETITPADDPTPTAIIYTPTRTTATRTATVKVQFNPSIGISQISTSLAKSLGWRESDGSVLGCHILIGDKTLINCEVVDGLNSEGLHIPSHAQHFI